MANDENEKPKTLDDLLKLPINEVTGMSMTDFCAAIGLPAIPESVLSGVREQASKMTRLDLASYTLSKLVSAHSVLADMIHRMQKRCAVCRDSESQCAHCTADALLYAKCQSEAMTVLVVTFLAMQPGTRCHDEATADKLRHAGLLS
jgi:hypothetical protein